MQVDQLKVSEVLVGNTTKCSSAIGWTAEFQGKIEHGTPAFHSSGITLGGMLVSAQGINVITGLCDQPIEGETVQHKKDNETGK